MDHETKLGLIVILCIVTIPAYFFSNLHDKYKAKCDEVGGIYLQREMTCITGKDLKVIK